MKKLCNLLLAIFLILPIFTFSVFSQSNDIRSFSTDLTENERSIFNDVRYTKILKVYNRTFCFAEFGEGANIYELINNTDQEKIEYYAINEKDYFNKKEVSSYSIADNTVKQNKIIHKFHGDYKWFSQIVNATKIKIDGNKYDIQDKICISTLYPYSVTVAAFKTENGMYYGIYYFDEQMQSVILTEEEFEKYTQKKVIEISESRNDDDAYPGTNYHANTVLPDDFTDHKIKLIQNNGFASVFLGIAAVVIVGAIFVLAVCFKKSKKKKLLNKQ